MTESTPLESILKRDRAIVLVALAGVTAVCWAYLVWMAMMMESMPQVMPESMPQSMPTTMGDAVAMTQIRSWTATEFVLMFVMWVIMMIGMMVPSASPMVLLFAAYNRKRAEQNQPYVPTAAFLSGYLIAWTGFSLVATILQWALDQAALLSPMMVSTSPLLGGGILIAAGVFQLTPMKDACLRHCRSPMQFVMQNWRNGTGGALRMGLDHGIYCMGCCWILMALLFFGGVMNLLWIAIITIFVLVEKAAPFGLALGRACGVALILGGAFVILQT